MTRLIAAYPISDEDLSALPVRTLDSAIAFYENVLGFAVVARENASATVCRDGVRLGLLARAGHDRARAGSVAIEVDDLRSLHEEIAAAGGRPGEFGDDEWDGRMRPTPMADGARFARALYLTRLRVDLGRWTDSGPSGGQAERTTSAHHPSRTIS